MNVKIKKHLLFIELVVGCFSLKIISKVNIWGYVFSTLLEILYSTLPKLYIICKNINNFFLLNLLRY